MQEIQPRAFGRQQGASVGVDVRTPEGLELIYRIAKTADVFLTNFLPDARRKLKIDYEDIKAIKPDIVYARGSAHGDKGPEREIGGFDGTAFRNRGGIGYALTPEERQRLLVQWNDTASAYPRERTLQSLFEQMAARRPAACAVVDGARKHSPCPLMTTTGR